MCIVKSKVHYASWSETCSLARASEQVSDSWFVGVYDKLTTFSGRKTCLGQALASSRQVRCAFVVIARWTLENDQTYEPVRHFFGALFTYFLLGHCVRK